MLIRCADFSGLIKSVLQSPNKLLFALPIGAALFLLAGCERKVDFSSEVKPILNKRCISCHGGVKRNAEFSLLFRHEALDTTESGKPAIIPFDANNSEMIRRLTLADPEERMPLKEQPLTPEEIDVLKRWINQGAEWGDHWAYVAPVVTEPPSSGGLFQRAGASDDERGFVENPIDQFVLSRMEENGLHPSPPAEKSTLLRRVYLDLTGLPPTLEEADAYLSDTDPDAYNKVVDKLLASEAYGEKWASWWLDLARYADTKGYERDVGRNIWRYRDWVIQALNKDIPFDQFSKLQLAGDLLTGAGGHELIPTAFHRNTMNNDEGGTEDEEYRVAAVIDRVNTTWEVWQSTTMACVQCHTHPYDPFVHEDYYRSMAFFNNTCDEDTHGEHPNLRIYQPGDSAQLREIREWVISKGGQEAEASTRLFLQTLEPKYHPHDFNQFVNGELIDTKWLGIRHNGMARLPGINLSGKAVMWANYLTPGEGSRLEIRLGHPEGKRIANFTFLATEGWKRKAVAIPLVPTEGIHDLFFRFYNAGLKPGQPVADIEWVAFRPALPGSNEAGFDAIRESFASLLNANVENTPVMIENSSAQWRPTHVFERGNWLVKGAEVKPAVPSSLNAFPAGAPSNRLGFAKWLFQPENPLTGRVIVNRVWEQVFGTGIVETLEDFGTQGAAPTHQELLDWLAIKLRTDYQWSLKKLIRTIVLSGTYRQQSDSDPTLYQKDPQNRWLARGPRVRLSAEQVRDQALAASGLLSRKMYGKPVMPYQPDGIWNSVWSGEYWQQSTGENQFRRSIYTYLKRTSPYPSFMMFDAGSREVCLSRRIRTNTPLQALVTMNDSTYQVASRALARRMGRAAAEPAAQIRYGYRQLLTKDIPQGKLSILTRLYREALIVYQKEPEKALAFMAEAEATPAQASLTVVALALLNLDEVMTKE